MRVTEAARTDELRVSPVEYGALFSRNFLEARLPGWPEFRDLDCRELMEAIRQLWEQERAGLPEANEAQVEDSSV